MNRLAVWTGIAVLILGAFNLLTTATELEPIFQNYRIIGEPIGYAASRKARFFVEDVAIAAVGAALAFVALRKPQFSN